MSLFGHKCCECGYRVATIPWAIRSRRLIWVCVHCYEAYDYMSYFFKPLEER